RIICNKVAFKPLIFQALSATKQGRERFCGATLPHLMPNHVPARGASARSTAPKERWSRHAFHFRNTRYVFSLRRLIHRYHHDLYNRLIYLHMDDTTLQRARLFPAYPSRHGAPLRRRYPSETAPRPRGRSAKPRGLPQTARPPKERALPPPRA